MQIMRFSCTFHKCQRSMFFRGNVTPKINKRWNSLGMAVGGGGWLISNCLLALQSCYMKMMIVFYSACISIIESASRISF